MFAVHALLCLSLHIFQELPALTREVPADLESALDRLSARFTELGVPDSALSRIELRPLDRDEVEKEMQRVRYRLSQWGVGGTARTAVARRAAESLYRSQECLLAELPGETERFLVVFAPIGADEARIGLGDNWAACALLTELCATLKDDARRHRILFLAGAPRGGGQASLSALIDTHRFSLGDCDGALCLEGLGFGEPAYGVNSANPLLLLGRFLGCQLRPDGLEIRRYLDGESESPVQPLRAAGVPTLSIEGTGIENPEARPDLPLDPDHFRQTLDLVTRMVRVLDEFPAPPVWTSVHDWLSAHEDRNLELPLRITKYRLFGASGPERVRSDDPKDGGR